MNSLTQHAKKTFEGKKEIWQNQTICDNKRDHDKKKGKYATCIGWRTQSNVKHLRSVFKTRDYVCFLSLTSHEKLTDN